MLTLLTLSHKCACFDQLIGCLLPLLDIQIPLTIFVWFCIPKPQHTMEQSQQDATTDLPGMCLPRCPNFCSVSCTPGCMLLSQTHVFFLLSVTSKTSIIAQVSQKKAQAFLTSSSQGFCGQQKKLLGAAEQTDLPPARPRRGTDTSSAKTRDHKMVLQENIFPSVVLVSGELH